MIGPTTLSIHRLLLLVVAVVVATVPIVSAQTSGWYLGLAGQSCHAVCLSADRDGLLDCTSDSESQQEQVLDANNLVYVSTNLVTGQSSCATFAAALAGVNTFPSQESGTDPECAYSPTGGEASPCAAADTSAIPVVRRFCCCLAAGADASTVCQVIEAPSAEPSGMPSASPTSSTMPSSKPSRKPSAKPSMMPSPWIDTCPGADSPVLGILYTLFCLLVKLITFGWL